MLTERWSKDTNRNGDPIRTASLEDERLINGRVYKVRLDRRMRRGRESRFFRVYTRREADRIVREWLVEGVVRLNK